jgi:hypothetical protein
MTDLDHEQDSDYLRQSAVPRLGMESTQSSDMDRKPNLNPALDVEPSTSPSPSASASASPPVPPSPKPVPPPPPSVVKKTFFMSIIVILGMVNSFGAGTTLIGPKIQEDLGFGTSELQVSSRWLYTGCVDVVVLILIRRLFVRLDVIEKKWLSTSFYIPLVSRLPLVCSAVRSLIVTIPQLIVPFTSLRSST